MAPALCTMTSARAICTLATRKHSCVTVSGLTLLRQHSSAEHGGTSAQRSPSWHAARGFGPGRQGPRQSNLGTRALGSLRQQLASDVGDEERGRARELARGMRLQEEEEQRGAGLHGASSAERSKKPKVRSIGENNGLRSRSAGRRPDQRASPRRQPLTRDVSALEKKRRQHESTSRRRGGGLDENYPTPYAIWGIIGANCVVFVMWQNASIRRFMGKNFAISAAGVVKEGRVHTIVTSIFSHYDPVHLGANMGYLLFFGKELLPVLGRARFLGLFLGAGVVSSIAQVAWPFVAPESLRYSQYQLGLGARSHSLSLILSHTFSLFLAACLSVCLSLSLSVSLEILSVSLEILSVSLKILSVSFSLPHSLCMKIHVYLYIDIHIYIYICIYIYI